MHACYYGIMCSGVTEPGPTRAGAQATEVFFLIIFLNYYIFLIF